MDREIPVLQFINDDVGRSYGRAFICIPSFRIGIVPIDHGTTKAVHADSLGCNSGSLFKPLSVLLHPEGIERTLKVLIDNRLPESVLELLHVNYLGCSLIRR